MCTAKGSSGVLCQHTLKDRTFELSRTDFELNGPPGFTERALPAGAKTAIVARLRSLDSGQLTFVQQVQVQPNGSAPYFTDDPDHPQVRTAPTTGDTRYRSGLTLGVTGAGSDMTFGSDGIGTRAVTAAQVSTRLTGHPTLVLLLLRADGSVLSAGEIYEP